MSEKRIVATFYPQEWIQNYAVDVQPEGPQVFDVTETVVAMGVDKALSLRDNADESDMLARIGSAPRWIREWSGPYWIEVQRSVSEYYAEAAR